MKASPSGHCAKHGGWVEKLELDHKKPLHKGGRHTLSNLQWLCHDCHAKKTKRDTAYLKKTPEFREKIRKIVTAGWKIPSIRAAHLRGAARGPRSEAFKRKIRRIVKVRMSTPVVREKLRIAWVHRKRKFGPSGSPS